MTNNTYVRSGGAVTSVSIGNENIEHDEESLGDAEALRRAFRDERYQTSASYRQRVQEAVEATGVVTDSAPNAGLGRYQVMPPAQKSKSELAHEQAMIARASKAGI
ncbi:hypothetical protein [Bradyrhizobium embrapense]